MQTSFSYEETHHRWLKNLKETDMLLFQMFFQKKKSKQLTRCFIDYDKLPKPELNDMMEDIMKLV